MKEKDMQSVGVSYTALVGKPKASAEGYVSYQLTSFVTFQGKFVHASSELLEDGATRTFTIYQNDQGYYVCRKEYVPVEVGEEIKIAFMVAEKDEQIVDFFGYDQLAREFYEKLEVVQPLMPFLKSIQFRVSHETDDPS